ncbi:NAD-dependent epimerase/dehydratase family protein [Sphingomonas psychrotolerans]|uniref:NAD-dependent epimerase/dehydratase family protein n=1 Tax=Sphingomonas psychrotolerans TaxID=1327635 RepID=UPI0018F6ACEA|nr:NAD-dependent epimerase/dehydratase family protein [Sphingomonas psychrotolerans]
MLVTGGLGLLGSAIARHLVHAGARVTIVDSLEPLFGGNRNNIASIENQVEVHIGDIGDTDLMARLVRGKTHIFELAAQISHMDSMHNPQRDLAINCAGTLGLLELCRRLAPEIRVVFASTRQIYGTPQYLPVDEQHRLRPPDINGIHKVAAEDYHRLYNEVYGLRSTTLRLTNIYGPGMRVRDARQTFVGLWFKLLIEGRPISIFGDGQQRRDFTYVDDCAEAFLAAAGDAHVGATYNLGGDGPVSLTELARRMMAANGGGEVAHIPFPADRKAIDIGDYWADDSAFRGASDWLPRTSLDKGLQSTLAFYRQHLPAYL